MIQKDLGGAPSFGSASLPDTQPSSAQPPLGLQPLPVQFHGQANDYFGVWIVNVLLTVITLGIWSAWATVRTNRWFYGHTLINGHAFEYHATPQQILKGRLIAMALIVSTSVLGYVVPWAEIVFFGLVILAMPWAINAGLRFGASMTSWSNVRFDFHGSYGRAFAIFLLMPIAVMATLGLAAPVHAKLQGIYLAEGYRYGGASFACAPRLGVLYRALGRSALLAIGVAAPGLLAFAAGMPAWFAFAGLYAAVFAGGLYYGACVRNELYNHTTIQGGHCLQSRLAPMRYVWIVVSGLLATAATLTLAHPWARVRQYRYLAESTTLLAAPGLDKFVSEQRRAPSSFGGEFGELEGFASAVSI
ncbi:Inner membrane protein YjgN [compost metagenome]